MTPTWARPEFVRIFTSANWVEIEIAVSVLCSAEINVIVLDENLCRLNPALAIVLDGIKLLVPTEDVTDASAMLRETLGVHGSPPFSGAISIFPLIRSMIATVAFFWICCIAGLAVGAIVLSH
jgi:hypothetical protein